MAQLPDDDGSSDAQRVLEAKRMLREADSNGDGRISLQVGPKVTKPGVWGPERNAC